MSVLLNLLREKRIFWLLTAANITFVVLYVLLSYYNRISLDDFYFLANVQQNNFIDATIKEHQTWSGRWTAVLLNHFVLSFYDTGYFLTLFNILTFIFFVFSIMLLINNINCIFGFPKLSKIRNINLAVFIVAAIFFSTVKIDETWFWLCSTCTYLVCVLMFILGLALFFSPNKSILNFPGIIICFTYIGGSSEPWALFIMMLLILFIISINLKFVVIPLPVKVLNIRITVSLICCLSAFVISYLAEGNTVRTDFFDDIGIFKALILNIKTSGMIVLLRLPDILPYSVLFCIPAFYAGYNSKNSPGKRNIFIRITMVIFLYFFSLFIFQLPVTYVTQDIAAYRTLFPVSLFTLLALSFIFYFLGQLRFLDKTASRFSAYTAFIIIVLLTVFTIIIQLRTVPAYSKSYDKRISYLNKKKHYEGIIFLSPLPDSGLLHSAEITSDPDYFSNRHLQKGLGISADLILAE